ncbi:MAG: ABC transporter substrate-binding protein [Hydrogenophilales bacterium 16-64-46]|nr:MAG: ABC transporter substrate-binding protein [Hydrogenophilales bacterium 12-64-13]OYZ06627.1 MAG: ABC transporter substrate-binding protein [Hydrogenophilales bacterium 16-64-46]OZA39335.1 MAG: ABC transporter substrate-binding protein [Hydrogenophilales bacterium 17-64-34]HQS98897.1 phosphate/phosphite/phosphonate ABC transporter substrate-binding protein [Thiobacillus sp.]
MFDKSLHILLLACLLLCAPSLRAEQPPLSFGVFPNLSARQVVEIYRPLARALEKSLKREVVIYSARDFRTFAQRTARGEYDILLTAPHLAWLARQDAGYRPLLKYATPTHGLLVVHKDSALLTPEALRGKTLARADALAVTVLAIQSDLAARGLRAGIDYQLRDAGTHNNAVMQVINKRTDAAALGLHPYLLLAPDLRARLRVLIESPPVSSLMYLTHPRLRDSEARAIRKAMLAFAASAEGQTFMKRGGYGGYAAVDGRELRAFRPYALEVQNLLQEAP